MLAPTHDPTVLLHIPDGDANALHILREVWCEDVYRAHDRLRDARLVVDLGAFFGAFTTLALRLAPECRVVAVEPQPANLALLRANLELHDPALPSEDGLPSRRVTVHGVAVSAGVGSGFISGPGGGARLADAGMPVAVSTIKDILQDVEGDVDVLKVDVEGHEGAALMACPRDLMDRCRYIAIEYDQVSRDFGQLVEHLSETHKVTTLGAWDRGAYIYAERY